MIWPAFTIYLLAQALTPAVIQHAQAGAAAMAEGKPEIAIDEFKKVTEMQPDSASGFVNLGEAYFKNGNYALAVPQLEHALKLQSNLLGAQQTLGVSLLLEGNAAGAIPYLEKAPDAELLGLAYLETGRLADAMGAWQRALSEHPDDPDVLYYFSRATGMASKQALGRLMATNPGSARAHQAMADRDVDIGRLPDAIREYQESLRLKPNAPGVHLAAGKALMAAGNWAAAVTEFRTESTLRPASAETFYYLGTALLQQGQGGEALEALSRSDQLQPGMPGTLLATGKAAALAGDNGRAAQAHFELAEIYRKSGRDADADRETAEYEKLKAGRKQ